MTWKRGQPVRFETESYLIRSLRPEDIGPRFMGWLHDLEIMDMVFMPAIPTRAQFIRGLRAYNNVSHFYLGIFETASDKHIGYFKVLGDARNRRVRTTTVIGDRDYWGTNVVLETRIALIDFLFEAVGMHKLVSAVYTRNLPSVFNNRALGFRCEGILKDEERAPDGGWRDVYMFGLLRHEWQAWKAERGW